MMNSVDLDILPVDENVIKAVGEKYGLQRDVIPASFYGGKFGKDIVTVSASTELMINKNVSEDIAYKDGQGHVRKARRHRNRQPVLEILHAREGGSGARSAAASRRGKILQGKRLAVEN